MCNTEFLNYTIRLNHVFYPLVIISLTHKDKQFPVQLKQVNMPFNQSVG